MTNNEEQNLKKAVTYNAWVIRNCKDTMVRTIQRVDNFCKRDDLMNHSKQELCNLITRMYESTKKCLEEVEPEL